MRNVFLGLALIMAATPALAQSNVAASKSGAPFAKVRFSISEDSAECGRMGCEASIEGLDQNGKWIDLTSKKRTMNTYEDRKNGFVGFDKSGMPRLRLSQGTFNGKGSVNTFSYNPSTQSYEY